MFTALPIHTTPLEQISDEEADLSTEPNFYEILYKPKVNYTFKNPFKTKTTFHFTSSKPNFFKLSKSVFIIEAEGEVKLELVLEKHISSKIT